MSAETKNAATIQSSNSKIYQEVTNIIIGQLEAGTVPWQQPWDSTNHKTIGLPYNFTTKNFYQGINIVLLWGSTIKHQFTTNEWAGFYQWQDKNESIRKGERGTTIVYYGIKEKLVDDELQKIPFLKTSNVFNKCQLQSYDPEQNISVEFEPSIIEKIDIVDEFIANIPAIVGSHDGGAMYMPVADKIMMPYIEKFHATPTCSVTDAWYSTLFHELTHWTGAKHRLDRDGGRKFGDQKYAFEELVAEFGAAFLCAGFGIATVEKGDHAGYIAHWLKVLKENNRMIFSASGDASKAVNYLKSLQRI